MLDFLNQGIGGMEQAQGPTMTGNAGVGAPQPVGPTWGNAIQAGLQYGSKPGSRTPMYSNAIMGLQPTQTMPTPQEKNPQQDSLSQIIKLLGSLISVVGI